MFGYINRYSPVVNRLGPLTLITVCGMSLYVLVLYTQHSVIFMINIICRILSPASCLILEMRLIIMLTVKPFSLVNIIVTINALRLPLFCIMT